MRWVDRTSVAIPPSLDGQESAAAIEYVQAAAYYNNGPIKKAFDFKVYKKQDVADALNSLFFGKCAYCESIIKAVQPTDIEHFRPKGGVTNCRGHLGYWWLAASWNNLLPSCIDCNRQRYQFVEQITPDSLTNKTNGKFNTGKGNNFPILGAQYALSETDNLDDEDPALIDPTKKNPKNHLTWLHIRDLSLLGPRKIDGKPDPYGWHTYRTLGLNRQGLVEMRTSRLLEVKLQIVFIEDLLKTASTLAEPLSLELRNRAFERLEKIYDYSKPNQIFSAMIKDFLDHETKDLINRFTA